MASEMLQRDDLSVYVVAGVPRSFRKKLQKFVDQESKTEGGTMLLDEGLSEWVIAKLRGEKRRNHEQTPTSSALWRAYRALAAARYHTHDEELQKEVRRLRDEIEQLWMNVSPLYEAAEEESEEDAA
ncbi:MAG TPA: hypothetical protein VJ925_00120 [Longimicrobiales bacterium]|nr:hypothetical protein [Longimicrobiales bacterium]